MDHFIFKATKLSCMYFFDAENKTELLILFGMVWNWPMGLKGNNIFLVKSNLYPAYMLMFILLYGQLTKHALLLYLFMHAEVFHSAYYVMI